MKCYLLTYKDGFKCVVVLKSGYLAALELPNIGLSSSPNGSELVSFQLLSADDVRVI